MTTVNKLEVITIEPKITADHSVIWCHGLGADGNDFVPIIKMLQFDKKTSTRFIFPHAPIRPVTLNGNMHMRAWFDLYSLSKVDHHDEEGIAESQQLINQLIQQEIDSGIPAENIIIAGFSQGGSMALLCGLSFPKKLAGIIALSTFLLLPKQHEEKVSSANKRTKIFLAHGDSDPVLSIKLGEMTRDFLLSQDHPVKWSVYPMGHEVCNHEIDDVSRWLNQQLV